MKIKDWMTTPPLTVAPGTPVAHAQELMLAKEIRHLPIAEDDHVVGIITDRDVRTALPSPATSLSAGEIRYLWDKLTVAQIMTKTVVTVTPDEPIVEAVRRMVEKKIGALPVTQYGRLVGIITETDVLRAFAATLEPRPVGAAPVPPIARDGGAIRQILVPLDGSAGSETILPAVGDLALSEGATVRLVHIAPPAQEVFEDDRVIAFVDQETARIEHEWLRYLRKVAASLHGVDVEYSVRFGDPVTEIVEEAAAAGTSLIAMATHRRSGISRIVRGSVAEQVERGTAIPVMLVQYGESPAA
jgi:acetoin utilization protein AcuB